MGNPKIITSADGTDYNILAYEGDHAGYRTDILDAFSERIQGD